MVQLPATDCPQCKANLRTGEKPEVYVPLWKRKKSKTIAILTFIMLPFLTYGLISSQTDQGVWEWISGTLGLEGCTEPRNMWDDFSQKDFEGKVKAGYGEWNKDKNSRTVGQNPRPETPEEASRPEPEKRVNQDNRNYFASTLTSPGPAKELKPKDNWYLLLMGEWDVAYITGAGTPNEKMVAGEWTFVWINEGQALQDVLTVPYRWQSVPSGFNPVVTTTVRTFNSKKTQWEGFHISEGQMAFFGAVRPNPGQIMEHYQPEGMPLTVWLFSDLTQESFRVTVNQSNDHGATYVQIADIWAKKRTTIIP
jgi:hypothetical protein